MPVSTRSRARRTDSEASSISDVPKKPSSRRVKRSKAPTSSSSSIPSVSDCYYDAHDVENANPRRKPLKGLPRKDCVLLASILNQKLFDDDEIPNLLMEMKDNIQKRLESNSSFNGSQNNNDTRAVQTPLMKKFLSRCPRIRDDVMTTQRPSIIRESRESTDQVRNGNSLFALNDASKHKKKRKKTRVSYKIPHKSPRTKHRLTRSRSKAKPIELNFGSSTCSTLSSKETETDESHTTISTINTTVSSTVSIKGESTVLRTETESNPRNDNEPDHAILPPSNQSQNTKKRKPEFSELQTDGLTIPQSFDFGQEPLRCAAKKRILDLPSGLPPHPPKLKPVVKLERLSNKEINSCVNPKKQQQLLIIQENPPSSLIGAGDAESNKKDNLEPSQPSSTFTSVKLTSKKSNQGSTDVTSKDHLCSNETLEKNVTNKSSSSSKKSSTNVPPASVTPNATFNIQQQPKSGKNLEVTYNLEPSPLTDATFVASQPKSNSIANETYNIQSSSRAKQNLETIYNVDSCPLANATFVTVQPVKENAIHNPQPIAGSMKENKVVVPLDKIPALEKVDSPSNKLLSKMAKSKSAAKIHTPVESQKIGEKKQSATKLVRSTSSSTDRLQRRQDNGVGTSNKVEDFSRTPTSSIKSVKMGDKVKTTSHSPAMEKVSDGPRQVDKLTDTERIKKMEEKQDKCLRIKEEMLKQKKDMHKKKNEEWKAKIEKMRAEEEEKKKAEEEKRRAEDAARKELEERREMERKRRADELAKKEAEAQAKLDNKAKAAPPPPVSTFSVKAAIQALNVKAKANCQQVDRGHQGIRPPPPPVKFLPKHLQPSDKGATSSCPDIPKKCGPPPPSAHHTEKLQFPAPGLKSKPIAGSACQLASKDGGLTESVTATSSWKPLGKNLPSGNVQPTLFKHPQPSPMFKQPQPPPSAWKIKSPIKSKPVLLPVVKKAPIENSFNDESFVTVTDTTIDGGNRDTYEITIFDNIDEDMRHREGKYIPEWADNTDKLHLSLFLQQPNLIELMQTKCFPNKNINYQLFPKCSSRR